MQILAAVALTLSLLLASLPTAAGAGKQPIPVTQCGQVLDVPGGEYLLSSEINCGVTIMASHIHLDTAGMTISAVGDALLIADGVSDVVIDGGGSLGGGGGLVIGKDRHIVVKDVTLRGEDDLGGSMAGVQINGAKDVSLTGCTISGSDSIAVQMNGAVSVSMIDNNIAGAFGIYGTVDRGSFSNNSVVVSADADAHGRGIALTGRGNLVANNSLTLQGLGSPTLDDIGIIVSSRSRAVGNIVNQFFFGIELSGDFNHVVENLITGRFMGVIPLSVDGIETDAGATHNNIERNAVSSNQADLHESNGPPCVNVWRNNFFQTSGGAVACIH